VMFAPLTDCYVGCITTNQVAIDDFFIRDFRDDAS
jgi:hypothetical protein